MGFRPGSEGVCRPAVHLYVVPRRVRYSYGLPRTVALGTLGDVETGTAAGEVPPRLGDQDNLS